MEQKKPCESTESSPEPFLREDFQANIISIAGIWISARWYNRLHCFSGSEDVNHVEALVLK